MVGNSIFSTDKTFFFTGSLLPYAAKVQSTYGFMGSDIGPIETFICNIDIVGGQAPGFHICCAFQEQGIVAVLKENIAVGLVKV